MTERPFARKRSGGPKTAAGKAVVARNALSHGVNAQLVVVDDERVEEFESLFQGLVADFRPQGNAETIIVHRIAHLIWKQRRLDAYEHAQISQAALVRITVSEIFERMHLGFPSESVCDLFASRDELDNEDLARAEDMLAECEEFERIPKTVLDPVRGPAEFLALWTRIMPAEWLQTPELSAQLGMNTDEPDQELMALFKESMAQVRANVKAIIFLVKNREALNRAQGAVRAEKMTKAWNLERSHRYHTLLEGQLYRALKELRSLEGWRLGRTAPPAMTPAPPPVQSGRQQSRIRKTD